MDPSQIPLRAMQLPPATGAWPPAPGWWLLGLGLLTVTGLLYWYWRRRRRDPRRAALRQLARIRRDYAQHRCRARLARECAELLKRTALTLFPRQEVAALAGEPWLRYLRQSGKKMPDDALQPLLQAQYQPAPQFDAERLLADCRRWLRGVGRG